MAAGIPPAALVALPDSVLSLWPPVLLPTTLCLQYDNTKNVTYFATNIINSTPKGMIIATAVCSAIGPLFLAAYFLRDSLSQRKQ